MKKWHIAVVVAAVVVVGVGALFGGRAWGADASTESAAQDQQMAEGAGEGAMPSGPPGDGSAPSDGQMRGGQAGNMLSGSIIAADDTSITIETDDGSTKIVLVSGSTSITLTTDGSLSDLVTGEDVVISGTSNDDGTVTATSIRLGSSLGLGNMPGGTPPSDGTPPSGDSTTQTTAQ